MQIKKKICITLLYSFVIVLQRYFNRKMYDKAKLLEILLDPDYQTI